MESDKFCKCPECGELYKLDRSSSGVRDLTPEVNEAINNAIVALSPLFGSGPGIPLEIMPNLIFAIAGYKYPETVRE